MEWKKTKSDQSSSKDDLAKPPQNESKSPINKNALIHSLTDSVPILSLIPLALQQTMTAIPGTVSTVFIIHSQVCADGDNLFFAELISTAIFMCGICTFLQVFLGIRLPILQGGAASYIPPIIALMSLPQWRCPTIDSAGRNVTDGILNQTKPEDLWRPRINEITGALILVSLVHISLGVFGVMGFLTRYIGPLTIAPTVSLIGLSIAPNVAKSAEQHWGAMIVTSIAILLFSVYLVDVPICCPGYRRGRGCTVHRVHLFRIIPVLLGFGIGWFMCFLLTVTNKLPSDPTQRGYLARTDARNDVYNTAKWIFLPYPGQFGRPTFSVGAFLGMLCATMSSIIESIGDYYSTARICGEPPPPSHAINRGIAVEGLGSLLSGVMGTGHATTSYSGTIGFIGVTKVGARLVWYAAGLLLVLLGLFGKFGAFLATIPDPVVSGYMAVSMGMVVSIGISSLRTVDMQASRNLVVFGVPMLMGTTVPNWVKANPGVIKTGDQTLDQVLTIILSTPMFVGGVLGFFLDNTVPGTREERGFVDNSSTSKEYAKEVENTDRDQGTLSQHEKTNDSNSFRETTPNSDDLPCDILDEERQTRVYSLPFLGDRLDNCKPCRYIPICPTFTPTACGCTRRIRQMKQTVKVQRERNGKDIQIPIGEKAETNTQF